MMLGRGNKQQLRGKKGTLKKWPKRKKRSQFGQGIIQR